MTGAIVSLLSRFTWGGKEGPGTEIGGSPVEGGNVGLKGESYPFNRPFIPKSLKPKPSHSKSKGRGNRQTAQEDAGILMKGRNCYTKKKSCNKFASRQQRRGDVERQAPATPPKSDGVVHSSSRKEMVHANIKPKNRSAGQGGRWGRRVKQELFHVKWAGGLRTPTIGKFVSL